MALSIVGKAEYPFSLSSFTFALLPAHLKAHPGLAIIDLPPLSRRPRPDGSELPAACPPDPPRRLEARLARLRHAPCAQLLVMSGDHPANRVVAHNDTIAPLFAVRR